MGNGRGSACSRGPAGRARRAVGRRAALHANPATARGAAGTVGVRSSRLGAHAHCCQTLRHNKRGCRWGGACRGAAAEIAAAVPDEEAHTTDVAGAADPCQPDHHAHLLRLRCWSPPEAGHSTAGAQARAACDGGLQGDHCGCWADSGCGSHGWSHPNASNADYGNIRMARR